MPTALGGPERRPTALAESTSRGPAKKRPTVLAESTRVAEWLFPASLSWAHYLFLLKVDNPDARAFYEIEALREAWSARELERQIASLLFERLVSIKPVDVHHHLANGLSTRRQRWVLSFVRRRTMRSLRSPCLTTTARFWPRVTSTTYRPKKSCVLRSRKVGVKLRGNSRVRWRRKLTGGNRKYHRTFSPCLKVRMGRPAGWASGTLRHSRVQPRTKPRQRGTPARP